MLGKGLLLEGHFRGNPINVHGLKINHMGIHWIRLTPRDIYKIKINPRVVQWLRLTFRDIYRANHKSVYKFPSVLSKRFWANAH